jgi:hypothetical protein
MRSSKTASRRLDAGADQRQPSVMMKGGTVFPVPAHGKYDAADPSGARRPLAGRISPHPGNLLAAAQRMENPRHSPTLRQLERAAAALGKRLVLALESSILSTLITPRVIKHYDPDHESRAHSRLWRTRRIALRKRTDTQAPTRRYSDSGAGSGGQPGGLEDSGRLSTRRIETSIAADAWLGRVRRSGRSRPASD